METKKTEKIEYEIEDLMEMLGGDKYYSMDNIMYVYHSLREEHDEAAYYMDILIQKDKALNRKLKKCVKDNGSVILLDSDHEKPKDDEDEKPVKIKKNQTSSISSDVTSVK
jgi:hypothetical protein